MGTEIPYAEFSYDVSGGCNKCREGCRYCWAINSVHRLAHNPLQGDKWKDLVTSNGKNWTGEIKLFPEMLTKKGSPKYSPLNRRKPTTYFVNSKSDLFHPKVPFEFIDKVFAAMALTPQHKHLVLTKRVERMAEYCGDEFRWAKHILPEIDKLHSPWQSPVRYFWPQPHIHLGVTICTQKEADEILPIALQIPGFDWISAEPLLGEIDFSCQNYLFEPYDYSTCTADCTHQLCKLSWIVVGCESGPKRRPCKLEWIRSIVEQCGAAGVRCYVKQMPVYGGSSGKYKHKVSHNPSEWPKWARVRNEI